MLDIFLKTITTLYQGGYIALNRQYIEKLPIRTIDFADPADKTRHDRLVAMVENMLAWHKQLAEAKTPQEKSVLERRIAATDNDIDQLVYDLYGLTAEEINLVEGN